MNIVIQVEELTKEYRREIVVDHINFSIEKGKIYGLVGPNGAGKSTTMKMLAGLVYPTSGKITMYGKTGENGLDEARQKMSFMIENPKLNPYWNWKDNLERECVLRGIQNKEYIEELMKLVDLEKVSKRKRIKNYSMGMRQRLGIVMALLSKPEVLFLDEPVNGLDPRGVVEIRELLLKLNQEMGTTIVISSHILSELEHLCTDLIFLLNGRMVQSIEVSRLSGSLEEYYLNEVDCRRNV